MQDIIQAGLQDQNIVLSFPLWLLDLDLDQINFLILGYMLLSILVF